MAEIQDVLDALSGYFSDLNTRLDATDAAMVEIQDSLDSAILKINNINEAVDGINTSQLGADLSQVKLSTDNLKSSVDSLISALQ